MGKSFESEIEIRWADCDSNKHVRHSAYYDFGAHCRIRFFTEIKFGSSKLEELNIGPILFKEECSFIRELHLDDTVKVSLLRGEMSDDGSRFEMHHELYNLKGDKSAYITIKGAWMNLKTRKLTVPPIELHNSLSELPLGDYYTYKKSS